MLKYIYLMVVLSIENDFRNDGLGLTYAKQTDIENISVNKSLMWHQFNQLTQIQDLNVSTTHDETTNRMQILDDPDKQCHHIAPKNSICPKDFTYKFNHGLEVCYILQPNQTFPPTCPYPHFLPYLKTINFINYEFRHHSIWLNAFKNTTANSNQFEWFENGFLYGKPIYNIINKHDSYNKNCLVTQKIGITRVSCMEKHYSLCMYSLDEFQFTKLPEQCARLDYENCVVSSYDLTQPTCFCRKSNNTRPSKYVFCNKLAEPQFFYQTKLLYDYFKFVALTCWIGLYKDENSTYKWHSSKTDVNYTSWSKTSECQFEEGAIVFTAAPYHGWTLIKDKTLDCSICEVTLSLRSPILTLIYNKNEDQLELLIENFDSVSTFNSLDIYCFSDSNSDDFKKSIYFRKLGHTSNVQRRELLGLTSYPSYYWCDAFEYTSNQIIRSNSIIAFNESEKRGNDFVIVAETNFQGNEDPFMDKVHVEVCNTFSSFINERMKNVRLVRPVDATVDIVNFSVKINCHLTTNTSSEEIAEEYKELNETVSKITETHYDIHLKTFASSAMCLADITRTPENIKLHWPDTVIGASAIPTNRLCLDETQNMKPVTRKCEGDFLNGAKWAKADGTCYNKTEYSETTNKLFDLVHGNASVENITESLLEITEKNQSNDPIDVHLISSVLDRLIESETRVDKFNFSTIINNVMNYNNDTLQSAQSMLNSTDRILSQLDNFINVEQPWDYIHPKLIFQITELRLSNVSGLAVYRNKSEESFESYKIVQLYQNTSFDSLLNNTLLDTAILFPPDDISLIKKRKPQAKLVILIFYDDALFNEAETETNTTQQTQSRIVSVTVPGYSELLNSPIKTAFRTMESYKNKKQCSHWNYGLDNHLVSISGRWMRNNESYNSSDVLEVCEFKHMTHFGLLIQGNLEKNVNDLALNIITAIGSVLSLVGIIPIFLTALFFRSWRSRAGNVILLNFCIAIVLQIVLTFSLYAIAGDGVWCKVTGACMHYIVISEFCWMFVIAMLQHRRFVMVFKAQEKYIVTKCLLIGWGLPTIPVIITLSISVENYQLNPHNFCTLKGTVNILAYFMPIVIILICNLVIFALIIFSVFVQSANCVQKNRNYKLQIFLGLFLFFVLGMTWIFGFLGALFNAKWLSYIFCITATLRGLILFMFFIVGNEETRFMWVKRSRYYLTSFEKESKVTNSSNDTFISSE